MDGPGQRPPTVLIVDDEPGILRLLAAALAHHGFVVRTAAGGNEAVEVYQRGSIDLVLLDVRMPDPWDGPRTLAALRALDPNVRAVFMSGNTGGYTDEELLALGALRLFTKPFPSLADLAAALHELSGPAPRRSD
jgi:CheY-like chemotaxis protein